MKRVSDGMAPQLVQVEWEDACCLDPDDRWVTPREHKYVALVMKSTGYLLYEGKAGVILTGSWSPDCIGPRDQIPRGMIRKITRLKP